MPRAVPRRADQEGCATRDVCGLGVLPFVTDYVGAVEVQMPFEGGFQEQTWPWFSALALIHFIVRTNQDVVEAEPLFELLVHSIQFTPGGLAARDGGLIRSCQKEQSSRSQLLQGCYREFVHFKLRECERRNLAASLYPDGIQDAISFEKHG